MDDDEERDEREGESKKGRELDGNDHGHCCRLACGDCVDGGYEAIFTALANRHPITDSYDDDRLRRA